MRDDRPQLTDAEAARLWQRASELQEEAEREASALVPSGASLDFSRLQVEQVTRAAAESGISPDLVLMALAEQRLPDAARIDPRDWRARWVRRLISETDAIEVRRAFRATTPEGVLAALVSTAATPAFALQRESTLGTSDDTAEEVFVWRLAPASTPFHSALGLADVRVLLISMRHVDDGVCLRIRAPLFRRGINLGAAGVATVAAGVGGSWSMTTLSGMAAGALGLTAASLVLVPAAVGTLLGGAAGLVAYRRLYQRLACEGSTALRTLLDAVEAALRERGRRLGAPADS
jgi:hypothetical protein